MQSPYVHSNDNYSSHFKKNYVRYSVSDIAIFSKADILEFITALVVL